MIFGTDNLKLNDVGVQRRQATSSSITQHPNFDPYTGENDLSVITLKKPVEITRNIKLLFALLLYTVHFNNRILNSM